jgi:hypothetical protein
VGRQHDRIPDASKYDASKYKVGNAHPALSRWQKMNGIGSFQAIDWVVRRVGAKHLRQDALLETKVFYANALPLQAVAAVRPNPVR